MARVIVAIDGPAGAGKSTVAKLLAERLGYVLLDTGALYRSVALAARRRGTGWDDEERLAELAQALAAGGQLELLPDPASDKGTRVMLDGDDVSRAIREPDIGLGASQVSAVGGVRDALLELQRSLGRAGGVVVEGRDIGTVVFPGAEAKFFLTASVDVRARRRHEELAARGAEVAFEQVLEEVARRDRQDSEREVAPLRQAADARLVDSSHRSVEEVVAEMLAVVRRAEGGSA